MKRLPSRPHSIGNPSSARRAPAGWRSAGACLVVGAALLALAPALASGQDAAVEEPAEESVDGLKRAYRLLFRSKLNLTQGMARVEDEVRGLPEVDLLISFIRSAERGVVQ